MATYRSINGFGVIESVSSAIPQMNAAATVAASQGGSAPPVTITPPHDVLATKGPSAPISTQLTVNPPATRVVRDGIRRGDNLFRQDFRHVGAYLQGLGDAAASLVASPPPQPIDSVAAAVAAPTIAAAQNAATQAATAVAVAQNAVAVAANAQAVAAATPAAASGPAAAAASAATSQANKAVNTAQQAVAAATVAQQNAANAAAGSTTTAAPAAPTSMGPVAAPAAGAASSKDTSVSAQIQAALKARAAPWVETAISTPDGQPLTGPYYNEIRSRVGLDILPAHIPSAGTGLATNFYPNDKGYIGATLAGFNPPPSTYGRPRLEGAPIYQGPRMFAGSKYVITSPSEDRRAQIAGLRGLAADVDFNTPSAQMRARRSPGGINSYLNASRLAGLGDTPTPAQITAQANAAQAQLPTETSMSSSGVAPITSGVQTPAVAAAIRNAVINAQAAANQTGTPQPAPVPMPSPAPSQGPAAGAPVPVSSYVPVPAGSPGAIPVGGGAYVGPPAPSVSVSVSSSPSLLPILAVLGLAGAAYYFTRP